MVVGESSTFASSKTQTTIAESSELRVQSAECRPPELQPCGVQLCEFTHVIVGMRMGIGALRISVRAGMPAQPLRCTVACYSVGSRVGGRTEAHGSWLIAARPSGPGPDHYGRAGIPARTEGLGNVSDRAASDGPGIWTLRRVRASFSCTRSLTSSSARGWASEAVRISVRAGMPAQPFCSIGDGSASIGVYWLAGWRRCPLREAQQSDHAGFRRSQPPRR